MKNYKGAAFFDVDGTLVDERLGIFTPTERVKKAADVKNIVIAYEPIWAIGTGKTATADQADEVCGIIRETIKNLYGAEVSEAVRIQYGGSMNAGNAAELLAKPNIDGGLIGGASLKPDDFAVIIAAAK